MSDKIDHHSHQHYYRTASRRFLLWWTEYNLAYYMEYFDNVQALKTFLQFYNNWLFR